MSNELERNLLMSMQEIGGKPGGAPTPEGGRRGGSGGGREEARQQEARAAETPAEMLSSLARFRHASEADGGAAVARTAPTDAEPRKSDAVRRERNERIAVFRARAAMLRSTTPLCCGTDDLSCRLPACSRAAELCPVTSGFLARGISKRKDESNRLVCLSHKCGTAESANCTRRGHAVGSICCPNRILLSRVKCCYAHENGCLLGKDFPKGERAVAGY